MKLVKRRRGNIDILSRVVLSPAGHHVPVCDDSESSIDLVYPRGATLNVQDPAIPLVTSGFISYPLNRPIAAAYVNRVWCLVTPVGHVVLSVPVLASRVVCRKPAVVLW
jgi:glycine cleavage system aminomethyltransferase T